MEQVELENLSKVELFEEIKDRCKSRLKFDLYSGVFVLLFILALGLLVIVQDPHPYRIGTYLMASVYVFWACFAVWLMLFSYRLYKRITAIDTAEGLLFCYEKKIRNDRVGRFLASTGLLVSQLCFALNHGDDLGLLIIMIVLSVALLVWLYYLIFKQGSDSAKDKEIIEELKDLVDIR